MVALTKPRGGLQSEVSESWKRKAMSTAKARLHQELVKANKKFRYETWQLPQPEPVAAAEGHPDAGLLEFSKEDPMFACTLHLPDGVTIHSSNFRRKKDAEQDAALHALHKMGISFEPGGVQATPRELWDALFGKLAIAFSDPMLLTYKPLLEHFRAAVQRRGPRSGQLPVTVLSMLDAKITSSCKLIDTIAETNPARAAALVSRAAAACPSLTLSDDGLWVGREDAFTPALIKKLEDATCSSATTLACNESEPYKAVYIPALADKVVTLITLTATPNVYYMDTIAQELGVQDAGHVFMSRQIAKMPDGSRLYYGVRERLPWVDIPDDDKLVEPVESSKQCPDLCSKDGPMEALRNPGGQTLKNERASFLVGHAVYGDAIVATVGSTWGSDGRCIHHDLTLSSFHRLMVGRTPWGAYMMSRGSLLVVDLPRVYTGKGNWQGEPPKNLLSDFLQQHRLPAATYTSTESGNSIANEENSEGEGNADESASSKPLSPGNVRQGPFQCRVQVFSPGSEDQSHVFESDGEFRSRYEATQSAVLRSVLNYGTWSGTCCLDRYFQNNQHSCRSSVDLVNIASSTTSKSDEFQVVAEDDILGDRPPPGSLVSVDYSVQLIQGGSGCNGGSCSPGHSLESQSDFKFDLGIGAVTSQFEACVCAAKVGQTLRFLVPAETLGVLVSASCKDGEYQPGCMVEYTVKLLKFDEVQEDRIESSHFSPPLSKQRIEYARTMINTLEAKTLVDLGCGSGSLLEALLREPTTLEHMIGIDISRKALIRGAKGLKTMSSTLTKQIAADGIQSIILYEGSISDMDPALRSPDLATCIEVVEHMDPEPLSKLGESVLGKLVPKIWLVSTPNVEYNPIIRGAEWDPSTNSLKRGSQQQVVSPQESPESKNKTLKVDIPNLRNHDHRFEWTRAEFREWASQLATQFGYQVSFAGVGGDGEDDDASPGFATQIAVFAHNAVAFPESANDGHDAGSNRVLSINELENQIHNPIENCEGVAVSPFKELWQWTLPELAAAVL